MNINFSNMIQLNIKLFIMIGIVYFLSSILYFTLPKESIELEKNHKITLEYRSFNIQELFTNKTAKEKVKKIQKQDYQLLNNLLLKAVYLMNETKGWIIVANNSDKTHLLSVDDSFKGYKLIRIYINYVVFSKLGREYKLVLKNDNKVNYSITNINKGLIPQDDENIIVFDDKVSVQRSYLNSYINNFDKIWKDIAIKEVKDKDGKIDGFKVTSIRDKSAFKKLGLKKDDIIKAVNNIELKSYNDAFKVYKRINKIKDLNVRVIRSNNEMELNYEIK